MTLKDAFNECCCVEIYMMVNFLESVLEYSFEESMWMIWVYLKNNNDEYSHQYESMKGVLVKSGYFIEKKEDDGEGEVYEYHGKRYEPQQDFLYWAMIE